MEYQAHQFHGMVPQRMSICFDCKGNGCRECNDRGQLLIDMTVEERLEAIETKLGIGPLD